MAKPQVVMRSTDKQSCGNPADQLGIMKNNISSAVMVLQQTVLNIPQDEIDETTKKLKDCVEGLLDLSLQKIEELKQSPRLRAWLGVKDLAFSLANFMMLRQGLAGFTSKTQSISYQEIMKTIGELDATAKPVDERIKDLVKMLGERAPVLALPAPEECAKPVEKVLKKSVPRGTKKAAKRVIEAEGAGDWVEEAKNPRVRAARQFLVDCLAVSREGVKLKVAKSVKIPSWAEKELKYAR